MLNPINENKACCDCPTLTINKCLDRSMEAGTVENIVVEAAGMVGLVNLIDNTFKGGGEGHILGYISYIKRLGIHLFRLYMMS